MNTSHIGYIHWADDIICSAMSASLHSKVIMRFPSNDVLKRISTQNTFSLKSKKLESNKYLQDCRIQIYARVFFSLSLRKLNEADMYTIKHMVSKGDIAICYAKLNCFSNNHIFVDLSTTFLLSLNDPSLVTIYFVLYQTHLKLYFHPKKIIVQRISF